jgi:hypothetical protein
MAGLLILFLFHLKDKGTDQLEQRIGIKIEANANLYVIRIVPDGEKSGVSSPI